MVATLPRPQCVNANVALLTQWIQRISHSKKSKNRTFKTSLDRHTYISITWWPLHSIWLTWWGLVAPCSATPLNYSGPTLHEEHSTLFSIDLYSRTNRKQTRLSANLLIVWIAWEWQNQDHTWVTQCKIIYLLIIISGSWYCQCCIFCVYCESPLSMVFLVAQLNGGCKNKLIFLDPLAEPVSWIMETVQPCVYW